MSTSTTAAGQTTVIVQPTRGGGSWFAWLALIVCLALLGWQYAQKQDYYDTTHRHDREVRLRQEERHPEDRHHQR